MFFIVLGETSTFNHKFFLHFLLVKKDMFKWMQRNHVVKLVLEHLGRMSNKSDADTIQDWL